MVLVVGCEEKGFTEVLNTPLDTSDRDMVLRVDDSMEGVTETMLV